MTTRTGSILLALCSCLLASLGCGGGGGPPRGSVQVVTQALAASDVTRVTVAVSGAGIDAPIVHELSRSGSQWVGIIGRIPAGTDRTFVAEAFDGAAAKLYQGQATGVTITPNETAVVAIVAQQVPAPIPFANAAPIVEFLTASTSQVPPGGVISLTASARDPNAGDTLAYAWQAPAGTFDSPTAMLSNWTAPATEGTYELRLAVSDSKGATSSVLFSATVTAAAGRGKAALGVSLNTAPQLMGVSANPTRIDAGQGTALAVTASDADGDTLAYAWSTPCAGTFSDATVRNPTFTLGALPSGGSCALRVSVTDGRGGRNTGEIEISTGPGPAANVAPQLVTTYQSQATANARDPVRFRVTASDPEGGALTFSWSASKGTVGTAATSGGSSEIVWTAPTCFPSFATADVRVRITDAAGAAVTEIFSVSAGALPGDCTGRIAFMSDRDGDPEIYVVNPDGTGLAKLTNNAADDRYPMFSPDGRKIVFASTRDGNWEIYVMNADGTGQTRLTNGAAEDAGPGWSPDGTRVAFDSDRDGNYEIYVMNADGTGQTRLTNNAAGDYGPRFSPNGQKILFTSFRDDASGGEIHVMNADGSGSTRLTNDPGKQDAIGRWSPSGATIIWRKDFGGCSSADLWTMNADGSSPATLLCGTGHDGEGTYSPDGTKVAFNTHRDGNGEIYVMNADTTSQTRLTFDPGQDSDIDWGPVP